MTSVAACKAVIHLARASTGPLTSLAAPDAQPDWLADLVMVVGQWCRQLGPSVGPIGAGVIARIDHGVVAAIRRRPLADREPVTGAPAEHKPKLPEDDEQQQPMHQHRRGV